MESIPGAGAALSLFLAANLSRESLRDSRNGYCFHKEGFPDPGACLLRLLRLRAGFIPKEIAPLTGFPSVTEDL